MVRVVSALTALLLASTNSFAQEWVTSKPVWEQASRVTCVEHRRYGCVPAGRCAIDTGHAVFTFDFGRKEVSYADGKARLAIEGRVFRTYPTVFPNDPAMSILLGDGRLFKFVYVARQGGSFDLHARILGHSVIAPEIEVFELTCARSPSA